MMNIKNFKQFLIDYPDARQLQLGSRELWDNFNEYCFGNKFKITLDTRLKMINDNRMDSLDNTLLERYF